MLWFSLSMSALASTPEVDVLTPRLEAELRDLEVLQGPAVAPGGLEDGPTLVVFFASWCAPCRAELDALSELERLHGGPSMHIVAINLFEDWRGRSSHQRLLAFLRQRALPFTVLLGTSQTAELFGGVTQVPALFVFDRDGMAQKVPDGAVDAAQLDALVRPLLHSEP